MRSSYQMRVYASDGFLESPIGRLAFPGRKSTTMTVRAPAKLKKRIDKLAEVTDRSSSWLAARALHVYVEEQEWQIEMIRQGDRDVRGEWSPTKRRPSGCAPGVVNVSCRHQHANNLVAKSNRQPNRNS
jgi:predicted transcriptional regulator